MEQTVPSQPTGTCILGGGSHVPGARTDKGATAAGRRTTIADNSIVATDKGRTVSGAGIPEGAYVGEVSDSFVNATAPNQKGGFVDTGSFALVNASGEPLATTGPVSGVTLGARTPATDPLYNATDPTDGRRRHRQRADQPLHHSRAASARCTTTTTAGCARWRISST